MNSMSVRGFWAGTVLAAALATLGLTGCFRIDVDKDANGKEKKVQIDTPFGGVHVNTDQTTAADLGLPVYPGASEITDDDNHKSADVHLGFGDWQLRVKAVSYASGDSQEKVVTFYKKELGRFGDVITCSGNSPVGTPAMTHDGLTCSDSGQNGNVKIDNNDWKTGLQLKAGSRRHQHIVGFEDPKNGKTRFALVALDLPANMGNDGSKE
jgi:hypothetical protein